MRAMRIHDKRDVRLHDEDVPAPGPEEVLIRIGRVGICASDVHWYLDGRIGTSVITAPVVLGHESAGTICGLGPGVKGLAIGERVAIEPSRPCWKCEYCIKGFHNVCPNHHFMGHFPVDGAFRDYITWPAKLVAPVPDALSLEEAAMVEPLGVGIHAVNISDIQPGVTVAVLGAGAIGLSVLQYLRLKKAGKIVVIEPIEERQTLAKQLGADMTATPDAAAAICDDITGGKGFDLVYECAGEADSVAQCATIARIMGQVVIVGIPYDDSYSFPASVARRKQLRAVFSRRSNVPVEEAVAIAARDDIDIAAFATHSWRLEELPNALEAAAKREKGLIRAVIRVEEPA